MQDTLMTDNNCSLIGDPLAPQAQPVQQQQQPATEQQSIEIEIKPTIIPSYSSGDVRVAPTFILPHQTTSYNNPSASVNHFHQQHQEEPENLAASLLRDHGVMDDEEEEESQVSQRIGLSRARSLHQWHPTWSHLIWEAVG